MNITVGEICTATGARLLCGDPATFITGIKTDSRDISAGDIFVPIKGEKTDAHMFIGDVFAAGAAASFTENENELFGEAGALLYTENNLAALQKLASYYRDCFSVPIIGITGSVGKTTTKEMVALALSSEKNVMYTKGNQNSQIGLPVTIMDLKKENDCAVIEMGMSDFNEMSRLSAIAKPDIAVMTNIGVSHIANLHSQNNIMLEKLHITDGFGKNNILFLNGDDPYLSKLSGALPFRTVTFGLGENCQWRGINNCRSSYGVSFDLISPKGKTHVYVPASGIHNVRNAAAAIAVADALGISSSAAAAKLAEYAPLAMRQQLHTAGGVTIIDDTYNASPDSVRSGIDILADQKNPGRKIAVLADMKELGAYSQKGHREIGEYAAQKKIDAVFAVGEDVKYTIEAAQAGGVLCFSFEDNASLSEKLLEFLLPGDAVIVKGSRSMHTEEIIKNLLEKL